MQIWAGRGGVDVRPLVFSIRHSASHRAAHALCNVARKKVVLGHEFESIVLLDDAVNGSGGPQFPDASPQEAKC